MFQDSQGGGKVSVAFGINFSFFYLQKRPFTEALFIFTQTSLVFMETFLLHPSLSPRACAPAPHKHSIPKQSNSHDNKRPLRDTARKNCPQVANVQK